MKLSCTFVASCLAFFLLSRLAWFPPVPPVDWFHLRSRNLCLFRLIFVYLVKSLFSFLVFYDSLCCGSYTQTAESCFCSAQQGAFHPQPQSPFHGSLLLPYWKKNRAHSLTFFTFSQDNFHVMTWLWVLARRLSYFIVTLSRYFMKIITFLCDNVFFFIWVE